MQNLRSFFLFILFLFGSAATVSAQTTTIYQDDFETGISGWSNNSSDFDPDVTTFLGRFDNNPTTTSRTFTVPANADFVEIVFDFYRFDSWDNNARWGFDRFQIDIDGSQIFSLPFQIIPQGQRSGVSGNVSWEHIPLTGRVELAFGTGQYWFDQIHQFTIRVDSPGTTLDLTLRCAVNQGGNDESCGYDNFLVTSHTLNPMPNLNVSKSLDMVANTYALPGNLVDYTINIQNTGGPVDANSIVLVDPIPADVTLFTGNLNNSGNAVEFSDNSSPASGLVCCNGTHIEFSDSTSSPPTFGYTPSSNYDPAITHIRITPSGTMRDGQTDPVDVDFTFRTRID